MVTIFTLNKNKYASMRTKIEKAKILTNNRYKNPG